jgi:polysaccharide biosynthesis/export protein
MTSFLKCLFIFFAGVCFFSSCVPNKRLVYLQSEKEPKRGTVENTDSIIRTYKMHYKEYVLKPEDIITIRVGTVTPSEFDFVQKYEEQLGLIRKLNQYEQSNMAGSGRMRVGGGGGAEGQMSSIALDRQMTGFILDAAGNLELPYIGTLKLAGLTIPETEKLVREKLVGYFETPVVRIQLVNFHFTILGEVNNEGRYTIFDPNASVIDAITLSGNLTDFADRSMIKVVRNQGDRAEIFYVNTLKEDLLGQPGFYLQPNDLLIVPPLKARQTRRYTLPTYTTAISVISTTLTLLLFLAGMNNN